MNLQNLMGFRSSKDASAREDSSRCQEISYKIQNRWFYGNINNYPLVICYIAMVKPWLIYSNDFPIKTSIYMA